MRPQISYFLRMLNHLRLELSICLHHALSCFSKHPCVDYSALAFIKRKKVHMCAQRMLLQEQHLGFMCHHYRLLCQW